MRRLAVAIVLCASVGARADETVTQAAPGRDRGQVLLAVKAGGLFAEPFSKLGASYVVDLEIGYALPVLKHRLAIALDGAYTAPEASGSGTNPQTTAGSYHWHLQQREAIVGLTLYYRHPVGRVTPYLGVGPRLFLLQSEIDGSSGATTIHTSSEVSTKVGVGVPLGLGVRLGPGDLFVEGGFAWAPIDHRITGDSNTGALTVSLGYRFVL
jgi:opacity protein-like surface antigen